jgi:type I restriction enzyme, S subunit
MATLQDICLLITDGKHGDCQNEESSGYYFLSAKDVRNGTLIYENARQITKEDFLQTHKRTQLEPLDILIISTGATIGRMAIAPQNEYISRTTFQKSVAIIKPNQKLADPRWLFYKLHQVKEPLVSLAGGTAQGNLLLRDLRAFKIEVPPLSTQRKIAAILSAYDDLIENNIRRIKILEEMAQALYREWFVHFRFPGHEKVRMENSQLGRIPEGWEVKKVGDIAYIYRGRSYKSDNLVEIGGLPFLNLKCIERDGGFRYDGIKRYQGQFKQTQTAVSGDIIMAVTDMTQERRLVARAARVPNIGDELFVLSMDLVKILPERNIPSDYLYAVLRFSDFPDEVKQHANGANVLHLTPARIEEFVFALPPEELRNKYGMFYSAAHQMCDNLNNKINNLRRTRDLLLPKLISGEVNIQEDDIKPRADPLELGTILQ